MENKIVYVFTAKLWQYAGTGAWYFVSLPVDMAGEIRKNLKWQEEGWGRMKATAQIGQCSWDTSIWFDSKHQTYILPVKAEIRKKERLEPNTYIQVTIGI